ncbi:Hypothetical predicted protein, partial [Marmota monax]
AAKVGCAAKIPPAGQALPLPPAWFFPAVAVGPGAGVLGESALAARSPEVALTLVGLRVGFGGGGHG